MPSKVVNRLQLDMKKCLARATIFVRSKPRQPKNRETIKKLNRRAAAATARQHSLNLKFYMTSGKCQYGKCKQCILVIFMQHDIVLLFNYWLCSGPDAVPTWHVHTEMWKCVRMWVPSDVGESDGSLVPMESETWRKAKVPKNLLDVKMCRSCRSARTVW